MPIKTGFIVFCFFAEVVLGIYTYMHFDDLMARFMFFVLTAIFVAMVIIKLAGPATGEINEKTPTEQLSKEKQDGVLKEEP